MNANTTARTRSAVERMRATKAGTFARQARECWADSTPQQRLQMIDLVRYAWRNHTASYQLKNLTGGAA